MVAIFTGLGAGLARGSGAVTGGAGVLGSGAMGRGGDAVSVNAATGNLVISRQDEFLTGRGLDASVSRTYNSLGDTSDRDNNDKWQQSTTRRVYGLTGTLNTAGSTVKMLQSDGSVVKYIYSTRSGPGSGTTAYWSTDGSGSHDKLTKSGSVWIWTDGTTRTEERYAISAANSAEWRISQRKDADGNKLTFSYLDNTNKLHRVTTANGEWLEYRYNGNSISEIKTGNLDGSGSIDLTRTYYEYTNGRLSKVRTDLTPNDHSWPSDTQSYWMQYSYGTSGRITQILQKDGSQLNVEYDGTGRVTKLTQQVASGNTRVTTLAYGSGYTNVTGPDGQVTRLDYDSKKQLTKLTAPPAYTGASAQTVRFGYDGDGNVTSVTDADGKITSYVYDTHGNVTKITDPNGNVVDRVYDALNNVIRERVYASTGTSAHKSVYTRYAYDGEGHLRYMIDGEGGVTEYRYTDAGQLQFKIEYPEHVYPTGSAIVGQSTMDGWRNSLADRQSTTITKYFYDLRGNRSQTMEFGYATSGGSLSTNEGYAHHYFTYDSAGRLLSKRTASLATESFVYDGMGRLVSSVDLDGKTTSVVFDDANSKTVVTTASGFVTTQTYNKAGELISTTKSGSWDVSGTATNKYDKNGRLRVSTDETGYRMYYIYDRAGQLVGEANHYGHLKEYKHDKAGRVIAEANYTNALSSTNLAALASAENTLQMSDLRPAAHGYDVWSWTVYDAGGRVIQTIDGQGGVAAFEYDRADRLVKTTSYYTQISPGTFKAAPPTAPVSVPTHAKDAVSRSFYDGNGRLIGGLNGEGYLSEVVYDKAGQKIREIAYAKKTSSSYWASGTFSQLRSSASATNTNNRTTNYVYDGQGQLRFTVDSEGQVTQNVYWIGTKWHSVGLVRETIAHSAAISTSDYTYHNVKAKVAAIANATNDRKTSFTYTSAGKLATSTDAAGIVTTNTYDSRGRLSKVQVGSGSDARVSRNFYAASGQLRFTTDPEGYVRRYDYDAAGRNTRIVTWDDAITVTDTMNISQVNSAIGGTWTDVRYTYDKAGRHNSTYDGEGIRTMWDWYANGLRANTYRALGTPDQSRTTYFYDDAGNLTRVLAAHGDAEATNTYHTYDGLGNRLTTKDPRGKITTFTYDKTGQVSTVTDPGNGVTSYVYNAFGETTRITDPRGAQTHHTYNALGQVEKTTDAGGYVTDYTYTKFGELETVKREGATTRFQYDKLGRVLRSTDALGNYEAYTYNAHGDRLTSRNKLGGVTHYTYDGRGLVIEEKLPIKSHNDAGAVVSSTVTNEYEYDARGNRTKSVEAAGLAEARTTRYEYDKNNRLIKTIGQKFVGKTPVTTYAYDARGNLTRTTDAGGGRTINYYDDLDRLVVSISPVGVYTSNKYDRNGNVTRVRVYENLVSVPADGGAEHQVPTLPSGGYRETNFTYDSLNRMTSSTISGVKTGSFNGSGWAASTTSLVTSYQYDRNGNVVKMTDPNGNTTWSYYDDLGRKTAQIDGENYRTSWVYDAEGNVTKERRYANRSATPTSTTTPPAASTSSADRVTNYTYDLIGNRLTEQRLSVKVHNGTGGHNTVASTVRYTYNALGQVVRKQEGTGDATNYTYDQGGRLTLEQRQSFQDHTGATVTPTVDYYYNGVGELSRTRQRGNGNAAERITTYGYSGDKLRWMKDAEFNSGTTKDGQLTYFWYDNAGRLTHEYAARYDSSGNLTKTALGAPATYEGTITSYDLAGRTTQTRQVTYHSEENWQDIGPRTVMDYNAFGEVTKVSVGERGQTTNIYDKAGRVVSTNAGDGVWKHFGYDKNGNQTVAITSAGTGLGGKTFDQALAVVGQTGVNATYTRYDKRNMATIVTEEGRQLSVGGTQHKLQTSRAYNAFGEVSSETNALGARIDYTYNTMGRLIKSQSPTVSITSETGAKSNVRPTEHYYHDLSGRLVATRDANNNLTRLTLLAGSGYDGSEALVKTQLAADGGTKTTKFDIHGDARLLIDELGYETHQSFDRMGRLIERKELRQKYNNNSSSQGLNTADDFSNHYAYDGAGQQIKHWNNQLQNPIYGEPVWIENPTEPGGLNDPFDPYTIPAPGEGGYWEAPIIGYDPDVATTDYDFQGRVTRSRSFGGDITTATYVWDKDMATAGFNTFGGWIETTTMANSRTLVEKTDLFGRITFKKDLGDNTTTYTYDVAGRLAASSMGGLTTSYTWLNSGHLGKMAISSATAGQTNTDWTRDTATYTYDKIGNRLTEQLRKEIGDYREGYTFYHAPGEPDYAPATYSVSNQLIKNQTATYDALGRMTTWREAGTAKSPAASVTNEYDAAGNVRRSNTQFKKLNAYGSTTAASRDYWYRYDNMNRVVTNQGTFANGAITRGVSTASQSAGQDITYNKAGQRTSVMVTNTYYNQYTSGQNDSKELYYYDEAGRLRETRQLDGTGAVGTGVLRSQYTYDKMGRQKSQKDFATNGSTVVYSRSATYNHKSQVGTEYTSTLKSDGKTYTTQTTYGYSVGTEYALGAATHQNIGNRIDGGSYTASKITNDYRWYDGAVQSRITHNPDTSKLTTYNTFFTYDGMGRLTSTRIDDAKDRTVTFTNDELGQIIRRDETNVSNQNGAPHEVWYRFAGRQMGYTGNNNTNDMSMDASIADRKVKAPTDQGTFRNKQKIGASYADFAQGYDPINSFYQGSAGGSYTVRQGDSLQGIAQQLWGDAGLWYKIAEANGMSTQTSLIEGQRLILPTGVVKNTHNAGTFKAYDPGEAIGDVAPTISPKPKKNKCGVFGAILLAVVAVAVTVVTAGAALAATTAGMGVFGAGGGIATVLSGGLLSTAGVGGALAIGAASGAVGSIVSQGVGVATGIQDKFSWKGVGMAALGGAVGAFSGGSNFIDRFVNGAVNNATIQGIGKLTGLQDKFSWAGVAAAGIGAGVGGAVAKGLDGSKIGKTIGSFGSSLAVGAASSIASAATRSAIEGSNLGRNIVAAIPDVVGQALGNALARGATTIGRRPQTVEPSERARLPISVLEDPIAPVEIAPIELDIPVIDINPVTENNATAGEVAEEAVERPNSPSGGTADTSESYAGPMNSLASMGSHANTEVRIAQGETGDEIFAAPLPLRHEITEYILENGKNASVSVISDMARRYANNDPNITNGNYAISPSDYEGWQSVIDGVLSTRNTVGAFNLVNTYELAAGQAALGLAVDTSVGAATVGYLGVADGQIESILQRDHPTAYRVGEYSGYAVAATGITGGVLAGTKMTARNAVGGGVISGVDASSLSRSHAIGGRASSRNVDDIADSMRSQGYAGDPIRVVESDGRMIIVDGHHRRAAAIRTRTPVDVEVIGPDAFPMGPGGWQSVEEVIRSSAGVGPDRLRSSRR